MKDLYKRTRDLYERELGKIVDKGNINSTDLELTYKLVDIIKDINEICESDDEMYGEESSRRNYGMRRSRYYPYMGEYTVEGSYGRGYSGEGGFGYNAGYSSASPMRSKLQKLMDEAGTEHERMMIQRWIDEVK